MLDGRTAEDLSPSAGGENLWRSGRFSCLTRRVTPMDPVWDTLRVATGALGLATLVLLALLWHTFKLNSQRARFLVLAGYVASASALDFARLGEPPILVWHLIADSVLVTGALVSVAWYWFQPMERSPNRAEREKP